MSQTPAENEYVARKVRRVVGVQVLKRIRGIVDDLEEEGRASRRAAVYLVVGFVLVTVGVALWYVLR